MGRGDIPLAQAGQVVATSGVYRADVQHCGETGRNAHLLGPRRAEPLEAEADLKAMRAAAAVFPDDRDRALHSMRAESRRLQTSAQYAREIEAVTLRRTDSDYQAAEEDCPEMENDADEWWRDLPDGKKCEEEVVEERPRQISTPVEATEALLKQFRPSVRVSTS